MSDSSQPVDKLPEESVTEEYLDDLLAVGGEVLRGLELKPEGRSDSPWPARPVIQRNEFAKGNVLPTVHLELPQGADRHDRLGALMSYCKGYRGS